MIPHVAITDARRSAPLPAAALLVLVGVAYFGVAKLGLSFQADHDIVSAVWPPSGFALAAAVLLGPRVAPAIFLAAVLSNATGGSSLPTAAGIATGNALAAVVGAALLARAGFEPVLRRVRDVVAHACTSRERGGPSCDADAPSIARIFPAHAGRRAALTRRLTHPIVVSWPRPCPLHAAERELRRSSCSARSGCWAGRSASTA